MLRESVEIVRSMWTEPETNYDGQVLQAVARQLRSEAAAAPASADLDRRRRRAADAARRRPHADYSNFGGQPDEWARKREILKGHCAAVGRDEETIGKTWSPEVFIRSTEAEIVAAGSRRTCGASRSSRGRPTDLVGTPEQVCEKIQQYVDLGCTGFIPWCSDYPEHRDRWTCSPPRSCRNFR